MKSINIFACANGVGLSRDIVILKDILAMAGHDVVTSHTFDYTPKRRFDLNIFLERFNPNIFNYADQNCFIPNQEWCDPKWKAYFDHFSAILTKTDFATRIFKKLGAETRYIGFTSDDRYSPDVPKDYSHWIHIVGKSVQKQTEIVLRTWAKNPGFPKLTILHDPKFFRPRPLIKNVNYIYDRLQDCTLKYLQNNFGVHVCPSETEGFGHYIMEALGCKAVTITTNAPPMNELVTPDRGVLVDPIRQQAMNLSTKYIVSETTLEAAVVKTMILDEHKKKELGEKGRQFFLDNDLAFRKRLVEVVGNLLS